MSAVRFPLLALAFSILCHTPLSAAPETVGPYVGTLSTTEAHLLYSPGKKSTKLRLTVLDEKGKKVTSVDSNSSAKQDFVAKFHVKGLQPGTTYRYKIEASDRGKTVLAAGGTPDYHFTTVAAKRTGQVAKAAFVSGFNDSADKVWAEMANHGLDLLCLGGDTPYVDNDKLSVMRERYRHMMKRPGLTALGKNISVVGTWDDHEFGYNNSNGANTKPAHKRDSRRAFGEYRPHDQFGNGKEGVYHKVDMGPMEIFILDPRWWSQTKPSPVNRKQSTCFGKEQWQWIRKSLLSSKAPFKILMMGQIWQDKKNGETDDMFTYWAERDALLDFVKQEKIPGVVLVGG